MLKDFWNSLSKGLIKRVTFILRRSGKRKKLRTDDDGVYASEVAAWSWYHESVIHDAASLWQIRRGDGRGLESLLHKYGPPLYSYLLLLNDRDHRIIETFQHLFLELATFSWWRILSWRLPEWLFRCARRRSQRTAMLDEILFFRHQMNFAWNRISDILDVPTREVKHRIRNLLGHLPAEARKTPPGKACRLLDRDLVGLLYSGISVKRRRDRQRHLSDCADCRNHTARLQAFLAQIDERELTRPPDEVVSQILSAAPERRQRTRRMKKGGIKILFSAFAVLSVLGGFLFFLRGPERLTLRSAKLTEQLFIVEIETSPRFPAAHSEAINIRPEEATKEAPEESPKDAPSAPDPEGVAAGPPHMRIPVEVLPPPIMRFTFTARPAASSRPPQSVPLEKTEILDNRPGPFLDLGLPRQIRADPADRINPQKKSTATPSDHAPPIARGRHPAAWYGNPDWSLMCDPPKKKAEEMKQNDAAPITLTFLPQLPRFLPFEPPPAVWIRSGIPVFLSAPASHPRPLPITGADSLPAGRQSPPTGAELGFEEQGDWEDLPCVEVDLNRLDKNSPEAPESLPRLPANSYLPLVRMPSESSRVPERPLETAVSFLLGASLPQACYLVR